MARVAVFALVAVLAAALVAGACAQQAPWGAARLADVLLRPTPDQSYARVLDPHDLLADAAAADALASEATLADAFAETLGLPARNAAVLRSLAALPRRVLFALATSTAPAPDAADDVVRVARDVADALASAATISSGVEPVQHGLVAEQWLGADSRVLNALDGSAATHATAPLLAERIVASALAPTLFVMGGANRASQQAFGSAGRNSVPIVADANGVMHIGESPASSLSGASCADAARSALVADVAREFDASRDADALFLCELAAARSLVATVNAEQRSARRAAVVLVFDAIERLSLAKQAVALRAVDQLAQQFADAADSLAFQYTLDARQLGAHAHDVFVREAGNMLSADRFPNLYLHPQASDRQMRRTCEHLKKVSSLEFDNSVRVDCPVFESRAAVARELNARSFVPPSARLLTTTTANDTNGTDYVWQFNVFLFLPIAVIAMIAAFVIMMMSTATNKKDTLIYSAPRHQ